MAIPLVGSHFRPGRIRTVIFVSHDAFPNRRLSPDFHYSISCRLKSLDLFIQYPALARFQLILGVCYVNTGLLEHMKTVVIS
ncbi:hypothetical protein L228DRAFT_12155 [Xylona heveae TC161]|uniref:Uncharacterized protein n=1 Tax=Xylona heveae (strain CBS 132557 / TC161) TaxID=1328760 RepID=A0A165JMC5_XYLHT|nr:hypothetical protein L228DRAFT_12155 [Xylona heveae TC161]KZF26420.1 hypothetical protein L228DRAFT_12155 [Xylona heveae TC161]